MPQLNQRERRRHPRYVTQLHALLRAESTGPVYDATVLDVSAGGILLATKIALPASTGFRVWIDWGDAQITLEARAVTADPPWDGFRLHAAFTIGQLPQVQRLNDLLLSLQHEIDVAKLRRHGLPRRRHVGDARGPVPLRRWEGPGA